MRKLSYFVFLLVILLTISCESPMEVKTLELADVAQSQFNRAPLKDGGDFSIGYNNGNIKTNQVTLTWEQTIEQDFKFYQIYRNNQKIAVFNDITHTSLIDSSLSENTYYDYKINVVSETGMTATDTIEIKTAQWDAPSNLQVNALSQTAVQINWDDNSDSEESFKVSVFESNVLVKSVSVDPNITEAIVTDLQFGSTYNFQVEASSFYETGVVYSDLRYFPMYNMSLGSLDNLIAVMNPDLSITLRWDDYSSLETGFIIERKINNANFLEINNIHVLNTEEYIDNDVSAYEIGDLITYRVKAYNDYDAPIQYTDYTNEYEIEVQEILDSIIYLSLTADFDINESAWNIRNQVTNNAVFPSNQTFDAPGTVLHQLELEPGWYYVHCIDYYGDGGISGTVHQGTYLLNSWDDDEYTTNGYFEFYVSPNRRK